MAYDNIIDRTGAAALIPEEASREILSTLPESSVIMSMARRLPDVSRNQLRIPVSSALASAYWVNPTDTGLKQTSESSWQNVYLNIEELAVIIPIPEAVLSDADYDIWAEVRPQIATAMGAAFDAAVIHGTNAPASFPDDLLTQATAAGHVASAAAFTDLYDAIMGEGGTLSFIEEDGYMANGHIAALTMKSKLRGLRDADGGPIYVANMADGVRQYMLDGEMLQFPRNGSVLPASALLVSGDFSQLVWAMRQDITYKVLDQAAIFNAQGALQYNLPQQDMVALRAVMRIGWALPNPVNRINTNEATRLPFAVLAP